MSGWVTPLFDPAWAWSRAMQLDAGGMRVRCSTGGADRPQRGVHIRMPALRTVLTAQQALEFAAEVMQAAMLLQQPQPDEPIPVPEASDSSFGEFEAACKERRS